MIKKQIRQTTVPETYQDIMRRALQTLLPPERLDVAQAAAKYRIIRNPPIHDGPWSHEDTPYLEEPMKMMTSPAHDGMIFVGPAQCGKTELYLNLHMYAVMFDPMNMKLIQTSQKTARGFSLLKIAALHRDVEGVRTRLMEGRNSDNIHSKIYETGTMIECTWPTINELSGWTGRIVFFTDLDRMSQDLEGNGNPFFLGQQRTKTFGEWGMTIAESSPSFRVTDLRWTSKRPHEAPPTEGILGLYNLGDRRMWFWRCKNCSTVFEPHWRLIKWDDKPTPKQTAKTVRLHCPRCDHRYYQDGQTRGAEKEVLVSRRDMNIDGFWLAAGQTMNIHGDIVGHPEEADIVSYWLNGVAASWENWSKLVTRYLNGLRQYERVGEENYLQTFFNTNLGMPYVSKSIEGGRTPDQMKENAQPLGHEVVPHAVRFLVAAVDVQDKKFVVHVYGVGKYGDTYVIDRFDIDTSRRLRTKGEGKGTPEPLSPMVERDDWKLLLPKVIAKTYPLADGSGRSMGIHATICDSGGGKQTTANSYEFYRWLFMGPSANDADQQTWTDWVPGLQNKFVLYKGASTQAAPLIKLDWPTSDKSKKHARARGDVPVLSVNTNRMKDQVDYILKRKIKGTGAVWFAHWLGLDFYNEMCAEQRNIKGEWINTGGKNEAFDCHCMYRAVSLHSRYVGVETINWDDPPDYAKVWDENPHIIGENGKKGIDSLEDALYQLRELGKVSG